jgi:hypothetical protein
MVTMGMVMRVVTYCTLSVCQAPSRALYLGDDGVSCSWQTWGLLFHGRRDWV